VTFFLSNTQSSVSLQGQWKRCRFHVELFKLLEEEIGISIPSDFYNLQHKHISQLGYSSLLFYFNGSPSLFVSRMCPEHTFLPWKFTNAPKGTWKKKSNHILFFQYLEHKLGINNKEQWYSLLTQRQIYNHGGCSLLKKKYRNSPSYFLKSMVPNHNWLPWKFESVPRRFWKVPACASHYFTWLCMKLGFTHPNYFYSLSQQDLIKNNGVTLLANYRYSPEALVCGLNPELKWNQWNFSSNNKWKNRETHKQFFEWFLEKLGLESQKDWRFISPLLFQKYKAMGLIRDYYKSVDEFIRTYSPQYKQGVEEGENMTQEILSFFLNRLIRQKIERRKIA